MKPPSEFLTLTLRSVRETVFFLKLAVKPCGVVKVLSTRVGNKFRGLWELLSDSLCLEQIVVTAYLYDAFRDEVGEKALWYRSAGNEGL